MELSLNDDTLSVLKMCAAVALSAAGGGASWFDILSGTLASMTLEVVDGLLTFDCAPTCAWLDQSVGVSEPDEDELLECDEEKRHGSVSSASMTSLRRLAAIPARLHAREGLETPFPKETLLRSAFASWQNTIAPCHLLSASPRRASALLCCLMDLEAGFASEAPAPLRVYESGEVLV